jgi:hypothetical protein
MLIQNEYHKLKKSKNFFKVSETDAFTLHKFNGDQPIATPMSQYQDDLGH